VLGGWIIGGDKSPRLLVGARGSCIGRRYCYLDCLPGHRSLAEHSHASSRLEMIHKAPTSLEANLWGNAVRCIGDHAVMFA